MTSKEYLISVGKKVEFFFKSKAQTVRYIKKNKIDDVELQTSLVLISAIWSAHQLNQALTESDLLSVFGIDDSNEVFNSEVYTLHPDHHELTLTELLDITVEDAC